MFSQLQQKIEKHKDISASHVDISNFVEKYSKQIQLEKNKFKELVTNSASHFGVGFQLLESFS